MENRPTSCLSLLRREMEIRNYSPRSVKTYTDLLGAMSARLKLPADQIASDVFKGYLHVLISEEKRSVSLINQAISAYKILQVDVLKRPWEDFKVKRPRRDKKLPVVLSLHEVERLLSVTRNIKHKAILMLAKGAQRLFKSIADIGIKNIELFDPATLKTYAPIIRDLGMTPLATHYFPGYITGKWDGEENSNDATSELQF